MEKPNNQARSETKPLWVEVEPPKSRYPAVQLFMTLRRLGLDIVKY
jgi:hypothetical protein